MDAIDDFFFESSFSGNSSDVTVTEEEILAKQQKKGELNNSTCISETDVGWTSKTTTCKR